MAKAEMTVHLADYDEVKTALAQLKAMADAFMPPCTQCGKRFYQDACGPTHAVIAADPLQHRQARWWTARIDGPGGAVRDTGAST